jgi:hypothetical protein
VNPKNLQALAKQNVTENNFQDFLQSIFYVLGVGTVLRVDDDCSIKIKINSIHFTLCDTYPQ